MNTVVKSKPFPTFIVWIASQREIWEQMAASVQEERSRGNRTAFYVGDSYSQEERRTCFSCGQEGHVRRNCPGNSGDIKYPKTRRKPGVKKFWCALHKDEPSRNCFSNSCQDLRKLPDANKRLKLLEENGDCYHCCGDHKAENCSLKDRVCGGGKENRGCTRGHKVHELFCKESQLCFAVVSVHSSTLQEGGVVLSIMQVKAAKKGLTASVFWDLGCTSNFVREEFARSCGFRGRQEKLSVKTIGDVVTDYTVTSYRCFLKDENGDMKEFKAYGMESITGEVSRIDLDKIKALFPHIPYNQAQKLTRLSHVDVLIGMQHPSWHPERAERAKGGGDFWLYRGMFVSCIGGRHLEIIDTTQKSKNLFTVVHTYHVQVENRHKLEGYSHHLEFCPSRVLQYVSDSLFTNDVPTTVSEDVSEADSLVEISTISEEVPELCSSSAYSSVLKSDSLVCDDSFIMDSSVLLKPSVAYHANVRVLSDEDHFFKAELLGVAVEPKCGGCKCSKCPIPGAKFSFKEQQEYDVIQNNLFYKEELGRWVTEYPWSCERSVLPRNDKAAKQNLLSLERRLLKFPEQAEDWCTQIKEMVNRGAAVLLSEGVTTAWKGDYYYLPLVGVKGKKAGLESVLMHLGGKMVTLV